jgi:transposase InsO family protein
VDRARQTRARPWSIGPPETNDNSNPTNYQQIRLSRIHRRGPWRHLEAVEYATLEWVDWFNHRRLLEPIGNVPPVELELAYHRQQSESALAA